MPKKTPKTTPNSIPGGSRKRKARPESPAGKRRFSVRDHVWADINVRAEACGMGISEYIVTCCTQGSPPRMRTALPPTQEERDQLINAFVDLSSLRRDFRQTRHSLRAAAARFEERLACYAPGSTRTQAAERSFSDRMALADADVRKAAQRLTKLIDTIRSLL